MTHSFSPAHFFYTSPKTQKGVSAIGGALLFFAGVSFPAAAEAKALAAMRPLSSQTTAASQIEAPSDVAISDAELRAMVAQIIEVETQHWSSAQKAALSEMQALNLKDSELEALAMMDASAMQTQLKDNAQLSKLSATGISSEQALKLAPTLLLSRYLFNIGRAAVWGGVVAAIRSADFDYGAMASALRTGDTDEFMSLLRSGITDQASFVDMVGSAATFACGSATLDVTPRLCDRFTSGLQKIFNRVQRSSRRSSNRFNSRNRNVYTPVHQKPKHKPKAQTQNTNQNTRGATSRAKLAMILHC
ncbi:MAG: hypothetical protein AAFP09_01280 [Cyanobacteria bacterium J06607_10]